jgi:leucyl aminopeptidase (aminopeptidase T)
LERSLREAAENVVRVNLGVRSGELFLVVTDTETETIGRALAEAGIRVGAETVLMVMRPRGMHGEEPPRPVAEALRSCDVFVAPTKYSITHTQARKAATEAGARGATMPGITVDVFVETLDEWLKHPALDEGAADYILDLKVNALGVDAPSPDREPFPAHKKLLPEGILIYENLTNLGALVGKRFTFTGLPLKITRGSASPVRAVAFIED